MLCPECGRDTAETRYCDYCGHALTGSPFETGTTLDNGRYRILHVVKSGGLGSVYKAEDGRLQKACAIKEMVDTFDNDEERMDAVERFRLEANMLARLRHGGLPKVTDYFSERERYFMVMDFMEGENLDMYLAREGNPGLSEERVRRIGIQICEILGYLHSQDPPMIYGNMKPSHIMIDPSGAVYLVDFGIAQIFLSSAVKAAIISEGYAPFEQYQGKAEPRSDLYSLGAVMFQLLTGIPPAPFRFNPVEKMPVGVSQEMAHIITRALSQRIDERFESAEEMIKSLLIKAVPIGPSPTECSVQMILTATGDETGYYPTAFINERDGSEMVLIRAGNFLRGSREGEGEIPLHTAYLPDFYISRNPITNEQFRLFVRWTQHKVQGDWTEADVQGMEKHPVVNISWYDAMNYCHWAGLRLPTEPEWEKAARGEDGREYPWGNTFEPGRGNFSSSGTMPVGLYVSGASPYGIRDMAGNVWEWVDDWYLPEDGPIVRTYRVLCGGSWRCLDKNEFKVTSRDKNVPDCWAEDIGFRAARYLDTD